MRTFGSELPEVLSSLIGLRYSAGERDFTGLDIVDPLGSAPLRGGALNGADFSGAFVMVDFQDADLRRARFVGANLKTCSFAGADLRGADFRDAALDGTTFVGAQLDGCSFVGAHIQSHRLLGSEQPDW